MLLDYPQGAHKHPFSSRKNVCLIQSVESNEGSLQYYYNNTLLFWMDDLQQSAATTQQSLMYKYGAFRAILCFWNKRWFCLVLILLSTLSLAWETKNIRKDTLLTGVEECSRFVFRYIRVLNEDDPVKMLHSEPKSMRHLAGLEVKAISPQDFAWPHNRRARNHFHIPHDMCTVLLRSYLSPFFQVLAIVNQSSASWRMFPGMTIKWTKSNLCNEPRQIGEASSCQAL